MGCKGSLVQVQSPRPFLIKATKGLTCKRSRKRYPRSGKPPRVSRSSGISGSRLFEQVRVRPCTLEDDDARFEFVDKQPVRFDVNLPSPRIVSDKRMIAMLRPTRFLIGELPQDGLEFVHVFSAAFHQLIIPLELPGAPRSQRHQDS